MISSRPGPSGSSNPSAGRSSAYVLDFICLFTHDLKRKQKRWEDGRLKYHTFNKRVMVYDERGNSVGDMHWQRDEEFGEGEEVQLDRGGVIIQVMECVGQREQDLSELLDKRAKEKEQRQSRFLARPPVMPLDTPLGRSPGPERLQTRHRPLNHVLGTPTGHYGRAVAPTESPFEIRRKTNDSANSSVDSRPAKRAKRDISPPRKIGYAQSFAPTTTTQFDGPSPRPGGVNPGRGTARRRGGGGGGG
ncbi:uncharacterized protein C8A04DRAFT_37326 [Dichotomopilus funicola]|uniref:5'-3' DNA helicase ZGRF1-like N-terminal domain-containing protein n=1 Tax=Dichotomopilus funicola TaxID=1934379 RepID=A0AAN6ZNG2_9PEZI|nr:hypothetical protein C8A04DRAFT_37326 [Dichotomopilus funicola]